VSERRNTLRTAWNAFRKAPKPPSAPNRPADVPVARNPVAELVPRPRTIETDKEWIENLSAVRLEDHVFQRVSAKRIRFDGVAFKYSIFDGCYLRSCVFVGCDFTGCRFVGSNFYGSTFLDCRFDYASFERTTIDADVLETSAPHWENLRLRFARTLRTNYQALGDSDGVNRAILVELDATRVHLKKAWRSSDSYYRRKYAGLARIGTFLGWLRFVLGDLIWGNGEKAWHLARTSIALIVVLAIFDTLLARNALLVGDWISAFVDAPQVFLGTRQPNYPGPILALIALSRYVILGLFVSVLVRRFARR
jgi:hypothetical protein